VSELPWFDIPNPARHPRRQVGDEEAEEPDDLPDSSAVTSGLDSWETRGVVDEYGFPRHPRGEEPEDGG